MKRVLALMQYDWYSL